MNATAAADRDRGSATLELVVLAPALLALLTGVVIAGRFEAASAGVEQASAAAARDVSLARGSANGLGVAERAAREVLTQQDLHCANLDVDLQLTAPVVQGSRGRSPGSATVTLTCELDLSRLTVPGLAGSRRITTSATSILDLYRTAP